MKPNLTSTFFSRNRRRLRELSNQELIVISANGLLQRGADSTYRFAQDANFWYLTGIDEPDVTLVLDSTEEYLIFPRKSEYQKIFDGFAGSDELATRSGIKRFYGQQEGWERLANRLRKTGRVGTIAPSPSYIETYGMYVNPARAALVRRMKRSRRGLKIENLAAQLARQRMIKQPEEIAAIQTAIDVTSASLQDAFRGKYKYEYELEAEITAGFRRRGATGHAFEPIVAAGERACTLHSVANDGPIGTGDLVVVDVGAENEHYAADITRTISFARPSRRQQAVYDAVLAAQEFAFGLLRPGMTFRDYRDRTDRFIGEKLCELGLIRQISRQNTHRYYPHSISHFLGLNVHDAGDYDQLIQPGMVLTVEPGIYIPEEAIGIRIEDDVLITEEGCQILSGKLPRRLS